MSDHIEKTPEARWRHLRENGPKSKVNLQSNDLIEEKPEWFDELRFAKAKEMVQKYFVGVSYSSFTGLLLILQIPDGLEPLLVTGNSKDIPSLFRRYLATIVHINSWYDDDVFDPETKGYKSIRQVRAMHKRVQGLMNDKFKVAGVDGESRLWLNQYDVSMTQFAFIGLAMLHPRKSAMILATPEELELINYYWRVLGYLVGVDDEFNACQFDKYDDIVAFNKLIFEHEYLAKYNSQPCKIGLEMTQSICVALNYYAPLITFNSMAHWWKEEFNFNGYELKPMSIRDRAIYYINCVTFNHLFKFGGFLSFFTKLQRKRFATKLLKKDKVYDKLKTKYENETHLTYYSDRMDYFNKTKADQDNLTPVEIDKIGATIQQDSDGNNNCEPEVLSKGGCPFGFSAGAPLAASAQETSVAA